MTAQKSYDMHRVRAFRDPDGPPPEKVVWSDPIEKVAATEYAMSYMTPAEALGVVNSPAGHARIDNAWSNLTPPRRALLRTRASVLMIAGGQVKGA